MVDENGREIMAACDAIGDADMTVIVCLCPDARFVKRKRFFLEVNIKLTFLNLGKKMILNGKFILNDFLRVNFFFLVLINYFLQCSGS